MSDPSLMWLESVLGPDIELGDNAPGGVPQIAGLPADYSSVIAVLGDHTVALADDPTGRFVRLDAHPAPVDMGWNAADVARGSAASPQNPAIIGVSRSGTEPWSAARVPEIGGRLWRWGERSDITERTARELYWPDGETDSRPTLILSTLRDEVWVLAMPTAEVLARVLWRETGCPWIDVPVLEDEIADAHDAIDHETRQLTAARRFSPPAVEILRPEWLPGSQQPTPTDAEARADLARLIELVPPPTGATTDRDWAAAAEEYGKQIPAHVRDVCDAYGRGSFVEAQSVEPARQVDLYAPPDFDALEEEDLTLNDLLDIRGERPPSDVHAVWLMSLGFNNALPVWLWRSGDREGLAVVQDGYVVCRLNATAAGLILDVVENRGWYAAQHGRDHGSGAMRFEPSAS